MRLRRRGWFRTLGAVLILGGGGAGVIYQASTGSGPPPPPPPPPGNTTWTTGNEWVDPNGGACPHSATAVAYVDANACGSIQAAINVASAGDRIVVKCGLNYPAQVINGGAKSSVVTVVGENYDQADTALAAFVANSCVWTFALSVSGNADKIHIFGIQGIQSPWPERSDAHILYQDAMDDYTVGCIGGGWCSRGSASLSVGSFTTHPTDILIDGWHGSYVFAKVDNTILDHLAIGSFDECYRSRSQGFAHIISDENPIEDGVRLWSSWTGGAGTVPSNTILRNSALVGPIMGVSMSEATGVGTGGCTYGASHGPHADCMQNNGGSNISIDANDFFICADKPLQWTPFDGPFCTTPDCIKITNNYFGQSGNTSMAIGQIIADCGGITFAGNIMPKYPNAGGGCTSVPFQFYGNILFNPVSSCESGSPSPAPNNDHNIVAVGSTQVCGVEKKCNPVWANLTNGLDLLRTTAPDPKLSASDTCAKGYWGSQTVPTTDFFALARPQGSSYDAGPSDVP